MYHSDVVIENNLFISNGSNGFEVFGNGSQGVRNEIPFGDQFIIAVNNTFYGNGLMQQGTSGSPDEVHLGWFANAGLCCVRFDKNIVVHTPTTGHGGRAFTANSGPSSAALLTWDYNWFWNTVTQSGTNVYCAPVPYCNAPLGTNTAADPRFVNPMYATTKPDCTDKATTIACMATYRAGFVPTATGTAGIGYQSPGACADDPYFPPWVGPGDIPDGYVTKPCGY